jgi:hypothetical protein
MKKCEDVNPEICLPLKKQTSAELNSHHPTLTYKQNKSRVELNIQCLWRNIAFATALPLAKIKMQTLGYTG